MIESLLARLLSVFVSRFLRRFFGGIIEGVVYKRQGYSFSLDFALSYTAANRSSNISISDERRLICNGN